MGFFVPQLTLDITFTHTYLYLAVFLYFWAVNEKSNKKEEVQTRNDFLP